MSTESLLINKVSESGIETIDLSAFYVAENTLVHIDFKKYLFMELIVKEKDFRTQLKAEDFTPFQHKNVYVTCSVDAVIPKWAFMLLTTHLNGIANDIFFGNKEAAIDFFFFKKFLLNCEPQSFLDKRIVLKGCGDTNISENAFMLATQSLLPFAKSIMYGEPCSTVPIFKKK